MNLISVDAISKTYGEKNLFKEISFGIHENEKTALIGVNGCGKSTLLKILAGIEDCDIGRVSSKNGLKISYLEQLPVFEPDQSIIDFIIADNTDIMNTIRAYERAVVSSDREKEADELISLTADMDKLGAWDIEHRIKTILSRLGIDDISLKMNTLSGGMLKKASIARAIIRDFDLLLLDEPTNHLDISTIKWLQDYLTECKKSIVLVTHDRYFLDAVCSRIIEINNKLLFPYKGNFTHYLTKKEEMAELQSRKEQRLQNILRQELLWLQRGCKARTGKQKARKDRFVDLQNSSVKAEGTMTGFSVSNRRLGKKVLEAHNITKSFDRKIIDTFSYTFKRGERIGLVGKSGCGKTTLLKMLMSELSPEQGYVSIGKNTVFGYFDQTSVKMNENQTVIGYLKEQAENVVLADGSVLTLNSFLERFLFPVEMFYTKIKKLSGGERRRLYLLRVLLTNPNFLVFDEPTNDLDIQTLSLLEAFLNDFEGCLLLVSHDRYFLDRVVDYLFVFTEDGNIRGFPGTCSQYLESKLYKNQDTSLEKTVDEGRGSQKPKTPRKGLSNKERIEYADIEKDIENLETEKEELEIYFQSSDIEQDKLAASQKRYDIVTAELETKLSRWEELAVRADV
jgi:ATP-binding cassette subfamily F protein uup